ncbi:MAG: hypothetical protein JW955_25245 [Sedimentisphaerales bacterium]|nr:hypothetical protein [Sedimentisphaerales bacterium]
MARYRVHYFWSITYFPGMTPFHESGGAGDDVIEIDAADVKQARELAAEKLDRQLADEVSRLSGDDRSYNVSIKRVDLLS